MSSNSLSCILSFLVRFDGFKLTLYFFPLQKSSMEPLEKLRNRKKKKKKRRKKTRKTIAAFVG